MIINKSPGQQLIIKPSIDIFTPYRKIVNLLNSKTYFLIALVIIVAPAHDIYATETVQASRFFEEAVVLFRNNDNKAAIIELKNAIQQNPDYLAAHILLGQAYLIENDIAAAEYELSLAEKLGADKSLIVTSQAQLYLSQIRYGLLLKEIDPDLYNNTIKPELHLYRGHAHLQLNQLNEALQEYEKAAHLNPEQAEPILGKANVFMRQGNRGGASQAVDKAIQMEPKNADAWYVQASLQHANGELETAIKSYNKAIEILPEHLDARTARAGALMDMAKDDQAVADLEYLRKKYPFAPKAAYLHAVLLERNNQKEASRKELEIAADILNKIKPEFLTQHLQSLMLAGLVNYSLERFEQASSYLRKYIEQFPGQPGPYKLLGSILLANGEAGKVIELLEPALIYAPNDYKFMLLLGTAYMQTGRHDKANSMLEKASALETHGDSIHTELGLNRLAMGQEDLAIEELEMATKNKPENTKAGITLMIIYINRGENTKALKIAKLMHEHAPENLTLLNLLGTAQLAAGQNESARLSFEKAISLDSNFITAQLNLSKLDVAEKKTDQAIQRMTKLNQNFPGDIAILIELAQVYQTEKHYDKATELLEKARKLAPKSLPAILALIDLKLKVGKYSEALRVANDGQEISPHDPQLLEALARSYMATGNRDKATAIFQGMARDAGFDAKQLYQISKQQIALADYTGAIKSLQKAVQGNENFIPAQIALTEMELMHGKKIFALNGAQALVEKYPNQAVGYRLLGDIDSYDKNFKQAIINYQSAFDREKNSDLLMRLYLALKQSNDSQKALNILEQWVKAHPQDRSPMQALAEEYLQAGRLDKAQKYYEQLLGDNKNQPLILNNLAYIYFSKGNPKALDYAEQAQQLAPEQPSVSDTLGWILVNNNKLDRGLEYLRNAHSRSSQDPEIRYHIAVALYKLNRTEEAKAELEQALQGNHAFNGIEEARALLKQFKN
ncbi:MAG: XrtA/PEP-CTERM system TPR-repeat protein PrsT [Methylobacter sp.]